MKSLNDKKEFKNAIQLFDKYKTNFPRRISKLVITQALKACAHLQDIKRGSDIHQLIPSSFQNDPFIRTSLIHLYSKFNQ